MYMHGLLDKLYCKLRKEFLRVEVQSLIRRSSKINGSMDPCVQENDSLPHLIYMYMHIKRSEHVFIGLAKAHERL